MNGMGLEWTKCSPYYYNTNSNYLGGSRI